MLIIFKSKAAADVPMYEEHARRILDLLGKDVKRGVITADETAGAISALETEIAQSRRVAEEAPEDGDAEAGDKNDEREQHAHQTVSFATRVYPFLEMLRAAHKGKHSVAWGI